MLKVWDEYLHAHKFKKERKKEREKERKKEYYLPLLQLFVDSLFPAPDHKGKRPLPVLYADSTIRPLEEQVQFPQLYLHTDNTSVIRRC